MRSAGLSLLLFALLLAGAAAEPKPDLSSAGDLQERFASWRAAYGRSYPNTAAVRGLRGGGCGGRGGRDPTRVTSLAERIPPRR